MPQSSTLGHEKYLWSQITHNEDSECPLHTKAKKKDKWYSPAQL